MCVWVKTSKISPKVQRKAHVGQGIPSSCHTWLALTIFIAEAWKSWWWMIVLESCQRTMTRYKAKPSLVYQPALGLLCHQTSASIASPDVRCSIILHLQASSWSYWRHSTFRLHGIHPTVSNVLHQKQLEWVIYYVTLDKRMTEATSCAYVNLRFHRIIWVR